MNQNLTSPIVETEREEAFENNLRPKTLAEYIGQEKIKDNLKVFIAAAKKRNEPIDHILLYGPPGLGKTSLAHIISNELQVAIKSTSGPAIEKTGDLAAILTNLKNQDVLFIDEIHRLSKPVEEVLYPAMEDFALDLIIGQGPSARTMKFNLPQFTLIGATTRAGLISSPLRDRFGVIFHLDLYDRESLKKIALRSAKILKIEITVDAADEIAGRSRGTPRIANRLLKRVRDFAVVHNESRIDRPQTNQFLTQMEIDHLGLDPMDRKILATIIEKFNGGPVGIETISAAVNEDRGTIEDIYEPFLIQTGFLDKTMRGRMATDHAFTHLGYPLRNRQETLL